jgi:hypothetical protein
LTITEKCALLEGSDQWHTDPVPKLEIPSIMMADGPHGLRKDISSSQSLEVKTAVAVCYPPAVTLASSFDPEIDRPLESRKCNPKASVSMDDTLNDLTHTFFGQLLKRIVVPVARKSHMRTGNNTKASAIRLVEESTARSPMLFSGGKTKMRTMEGIIHLGNGNSGRLSAVS